MHDTHVHTAELKTNLQQSSPGKLHKPDNDNDEIQKVPATADVGTGMHDQTIGQNFCEGFNGENNQKDVFHFFLRKERVERMD